MHCVLHSSDWSGWSFSLRGKNISQLILSVPDFHVYVTQELYMTELNTGTQRSPSLEWKTYSFLAIGAFCKFSSRADSHGWVEKHVFLTELQPTASSFLPSIVLKSLSINQLEEQTPAQFIIFFTVIKGSNKAAGVDTFQVKAYVRTGMFLSNAAREEEGEDREREREEIYMSFDNKQPQKCLKRRTKRRDEQRSLLPRIPAPASLWERWVWEALCGSLLPRRWCRGGWPGHRQGASSPRFTATWSARPQRGLGCLLAKSERSSERSRQQGGRSPARLHRSRWCSS